ncbi:MAG: class II aldolase/adducin family protein, partial [Steroidobacteraceae bacterium]
MDSRSPTPSVETLLHAWTAHRVIDHTHANAVLAVVDQSDGDARARELFGDHLAVCDYVMPGFGLAQRVRAVLQASPGVHGVVLLRHGIFTWGEGAREAYERMIAMVTRAEAALAAAARARPRTASTAAPRADSAAQFMPALR